MTYFVPAVHDRWPCGINVAVRPRATFYILDPNVECVCRHRGIAAMRLSPCLGNSRCAGVVKIISIRRSREGLFSPRSRRRGAIIEAGNQYRRQFLIKYGWRDSFFSWKIPRLPATFRSLSIWSILRRSDRCLVVRPSLTT